jgi:hypothetical protein
MEDTRAESQAWAQDQFGAVRVGDARLTRRVVDTAAGLREAPAESLPRAMGSAALLKGAYRLLEHPEITHARLIEPHVTQTQAACRAPGEYLLVEDTTHASFSHRSRRVPGLGPLTHETSQGVVIHTSLALAVGGWLSPDAVETQVLGLFGQQAYVRPAPAPEADRWARALCEAGPPPAGTRWVWVADREADAFEALWGCRMRGLDWVVRAAQARRLLTPGGTLFEALASAPVLGTTTRRLRARPGQKAREARLEVRAFAAAVKPPANRRRTHAPLPTGVVEMREISPPAGAVPLHWVLLTSLPCESLDEARRVAAHYAARWSVEEYHKALKTGTGLEGSQLRTGERLLALLGLLAVVAVDLLALKTLARAHPDTPAPDTLLGPEARAVLEAKYGPPQGGWTYRTALVAIARLGGFQARRGDGSPGWQTLWHGYKKLMTLVEGYQLAQLQQP